MAQAQSQQLSLQELVQQAKSTEDTQQQSELLQLLSHRVAEQPAALQARSSRTLHVLHCSLRHAIRLHGLISLTVAGPSLQSEF